MIAPDAVLGKIKQLPTLPVAMMRVGQLVGDARSSAADFELAIRPDPALTANLLRIANSAAFGLRCRVESVRQAVALLGVRRVAELAAAAALAPIIPERLPGYEIDANGLWRHCVAVAVLAEGLAAHLHLDARDGVFTAALLHDIGKLAIAGFVAESSGEILARARAGVALAGAEQDVLGTGHAEVGGLVAEAWRLPPAVAAAARWHHAPAAAPGETHAQVIGLVHLADALAHVLGFGADAGELARAVDPAVAGRLGLEAHAIERVAAESLEKIVTLADACQL